MTTFDHARGILAKVLRGLDPSGETGLEGLLRDAMAEVTGQAFRLAKAGPQGGSDTRTERANSFRIGLESKRYGGSSYLPLDELKAKLVEAAEGDDPLDLWILAATRDVPVENADALKAYGDRLGVAVLIFDWPKSPGSLSDLAVLCAAAPVTLAAWFQGDAALGDSLNVIRKHDLFGSRRKALLDELTQPDVGYACAAATMRRWIRDGLADSATARTRLDGFNDLTAPSARQVDRPALLASLDEWWLAPQSPIALLGDEGHGKTWAALGWWAKRDSETEGGLPLTIFLSARLVTAAEPEDAIAIELARCTRMRTPAFWLRRLRLWLRRPVINPQVLLIIDGLDQKWASKNWSDFLQPTFASDLKGRIGVVLTSRPDRWRDLNALRSLIVSPREERVLPFNDSELDAFLDAHGRNRKQFAPALLPLLKVPRLAAEAIERQDALAESGDVTPERLAYEDWLSRLGRRGERLKIDHEEFQTFVRGLAEDLRMSLDVGVTLSRAEIIQRLGRDSGHGAADLAETVSEIVSGYWLQPGEATHQFKLNQSLVPFVLGLALSGEMRDASDEAEADAIISQALDPFKGQDLGVAVLRAATSVAFLDAKVPSAPRLALLRRWLSERNFRTADFEAFWRLIGADKTTAFAMLERVWLNERRGLFEDEILIKGFANAHQFSEVAETLQARVRACLAGFGLILMANIWSRFASQPRRTRWRTVGAQRRDSSNGEAIPPRLPVRRCWNCGRQAT